MIKACDKIIFQEEFMGVKREKKENGVLALDTVYYFEHIISLNIKQETASFY